MPRPVAARRSILALGIASVIAAAGEADAAVPAGFTDTEWAGALPDGTAMAFAPDGRLFVCQQGGALRVIRDGSLLATPFASFTVDDDGERGLLGVAFDPLFASNGFVYVYHTDATVAPLRNRVTRLVASGDVEAPASRVVILDLDPLSSATNHNGGALHFGPDGNLHVAVGDNANGANAPALTSRLGKILRIDRDGNIPADNPFVAAATGANRAIWARGLRNPFTFAFAPGSGRMLINDVGQNAWEEIDEGVAGADYGWPSTEGATTNPAFRGPLYAYPQGSGPFAGCAITGGTFYAPSTVLFPSSYVGRYFFADFCGGWINVLDPGTGGVATFASGIDSAVDLRVGPDGALYYLTREDGGQVRRIGYTPATPPPGDPPAADAGSDGDGSCGLGGAASVVIVAATVWWRRRRQP